MPDMTVQPVAVATGTQVPTLTNLNYTNQDYYSLKNRIVALLQQQFPTDFTDLYESSLAVMLIEILAFTADTLSFKQDQIANEIFIDTVTQVDNAFRISELVGFQPQPPIAAAASFSATINTPLSADLDIPPGVQISLNSNTTPITYEVFAADPNGNPLYQDEIVIPAGQTVNTTLVGVQGVSKTDNFTGTGAANQNYELLSAPVIYDSVQVTVDGTPWMQVPYFTAQQPLREFRVEFDASWDGFVIFGDNVAGLIPQNGSQIQVSYRVGGGSIGNIVTGAAAVTKNFTTPGIGFPVPVSFTNYTAGTGGYDGDTVSDIQQKLPAYLQTQNRCVTGDDYMTFVDQFVTPYAGIVGKSTVVLRNQGCAGNIIDIYLLASDGAGGLQIASDTLKEQLQQALSQVQMLSDFICLRDGFVITADVTVDLTFSKIYSKQLTELTTEAQNAITAFFTLANWQFGQTLRAQDLVRALTQAVPQIEIADVTFTTDDESNSGDTVTAFYYQIIRPGTVDIAVTFQ
jgi:hypothetical protein